MNVKSLIASVVETILKVVLLAFAISYILKGITMAYEFGYKVFADEPMSVNNPKTISVGVAEGADVSDVAKMLEEKGLIADARLFRIQEFLSAYHNKIQPGYYDLSTGMTSAEMLQIMSEPSDNEETEAVPSTVTPSEEYTDEMSGDDSEDFSNGLIDDIQLQETGEDTGGEGE